MEKRDSREHYKQDGPILSLKRTVNNDAKEVLKGRKGCGKGRGSKVPIEDDVPDKMKLGFPRTSDGC